MRNSWTLSMLGKASSSTREGLIVAPWLSFNPQRSVCTFGLRLPLAAVRSSVRFLSGVDVWAVDPVWGRVSQRVSSICMTVLLYAGSGDISAVCYCVQFYGGQVAHTLSCNVDHSRNYKVFNIKVTNYWQPSVNRAHVRTVEPRAGKLRQCTNCATKTI